jgi:hypothetical protein
MWVIGGIKMDNKEHKQMIISAINKMQGISRNG